MFRCVIGGLSPTLSVEILAPALKSKGETDLTDSAD